LLKPKWRRTTLFLWIVWAGFAFAHGTILTVTLVFSWNTKEEDVGAADQNALHSFDYSAIFISASSGTTLILSFIDRICRVPCQNLFVHYWWCHGVSIVLVGGFIILTLLSVP